MGNNHMRRILVCFLLLLIAPFAHAAEMVNVEYIHSAITGRWGITLPYNSALDNPHVAANMKYLLTAIDRANEILNGESITDYGNDAQYATLAAADTIATNKAVETLAQFNPKFTITTTPDTKEFEFKMSAMGHFIVDWGDNTVNEIIRIDTTEETYSHEYKTAGKYTIGFGGHATGYTDNSAISFAANQNVSGIAGSIGLIFSTIGDGTKKGQQSRFSGLFKQCTNLTGSIPENLFLGIKGPPVPRMFENIFSDCINLSGTIPEKLFAGIEGAPATFTFHGTFSNCSGLMGSIPENLFIGIKGPPQSNVFAGTFFACSGLSGSIPGDLFAGIKGQPANSMFNGTFRGCRGISGVIPKRLFAGIEGTPINAMFHDTFYDCTNLSGTIPAGLFAGIKGNPEPNMFHYTFGFSGVTGCIPDDLFSGINATLEEILADNSPFLSTSVVKEYCSVIDP